MIVDVFRKHKIGLENQWNRFESYTGHLMYGRLAQLVEHLKRHPVKNAVALGVTAFLFVSLLDTHLSCFRNRGAAMPISESLLDMKNSCR